MDGGMITFLPLQFPKQIIYAGTKQLDHTYTHTHTLRRLQSKCGSGGGIQKRERRQGSECDHMQLVLGLNWLHLGLFLTMRTKELKASQKSPINFEESKRRECEGTPCMYSITAPLKNGAYFSAT